ncbi:MAG: hypothetical protein M0R00_01400 [Candidatus Omnitrophica bacterium]|jgi:hypothetical protein|nr:hypothetical protein [Candidatus Omnitrophota bacterium]
MKKIIITNYAIGGCEGLYPMAEALAEVLFHPALKIVALDLLKRDDLARKIVSCGTDSILLEETEYAMVRSAVEKVDTYTRNDVEFIRRVLNAETVEIQEKNA